MSALDSRGPDEAGPLADFVGSRPGQVADAVMALVGLVVRVPGGRARVPGLVVGLVEALHAEDLVREGRSGSGPVAARVGRLEVVGSWMGTSQAGAAVGCTDKHVRRLCKDGKVAHRRVGARALLVDVEDLRRHLRGEPPPREVAAG